MLPNKKRKKIYKHKTLFITQAVFQFHNAHKNQKIYLKTQVFQLVSSFLYHIKSICTRFFNGNTLCQKYIGTYQFTSKRQKIVCLKLNIFCRKTETLEKTSILIFSMCYICKYVANFLQNRTSSPECYQGCRNPKKYWLG